LRRGSNNYLFDGYANNNPMKNDVAGVGIPSVDFIQEFKVITSMPVRSMAGTPVSPSTWSHAREQMIFMAACSSFSGTQVGGAAFLRY
jgi:hypothetical protein